MPVTSGVFVQNKDWALLGSMSATATVAYTFTIASSTVTQGTVYSNNSQTYICTTAIAAQTSMQMGGTGAPSSSGTLTLVSGSGPATIAFSAVSTSAPVFGTGGINNVWWRRNGGNAEFRFEYKHTVAGTNGTGQYLFFLSQSLFPYQIDNTLVTNQNVFAASGANFPQNSVGSFTAEMNTSSSVLAGSVSVFGNFVCMGGSAGSSAAGTPSTIGSSYIGFAQGATASITAEYSVPIVGWSAYN